MRDQGRVLNHGHRSRVGRRGGGVWWVLQQEEGLSNNRPRGTWKGVDQYFSCYLLTIIWPAAPNTQTQKDMQARAFSGFSAHLFHPEYAANSLYLASADASMLQTQSFIYQLSGYQLSIKEPIVFMQIITATSSQCCVLTQLPLIILTSLYLMIFIKSNLHVLFHQLDCAFQQNCSWCSSPFEDA